MLHWQIFLMILVFKATRTNYMEEELALGQPVLPCFKLKVRTTLRKKKKRKIFEICMSNCTALPHLFVLHRGDTDWLNLLYRFIRKHAAPIPSSCPSLPGGKETKQEDQQQAGNCLKAHHLSPGPKRVRAVSISSSFTSLA